MILEQPEIHLHPLAQAGLADAILKASQRRNLQVIVESHSEHFLLRLQRRVGRGRSRLRLCKALFLRDRHRAHVSCRSRSIFMAEFSIGRATSSAMPLVRQQLLKRRGWPGGYKRNDGEGLGHEYRHHREWPQYHASDECRLLSVTALSTLVASGRIVIDDAGSIIAEYNGRLHPAGQPGVGDLFYRHVGQPGQRQTGSDGANAHTRADALRAAFEHGALAAFDPSDRVFALCAVIARVSVATATDSDWIEHEAGLAACGVQIEFVCGHEAARGIAGCPREPETAAAIGVPTGNAA